MAQSSATFAHARPHTSFGVLSTTQARRDSSSLHRADDGSFKVRTVRRRDLLNLLSLGDRTFHVVPEAVANGDDVQEACIYLCSRCHACRVPNKSSERSPSAGSDTRTGRASAAVVSTDEPPTIAPPTNEFPPPDLYHTHAPPNAIAGGHDYGRLSALRALGISVDTSMLERLVLARARCHLVAIKVRPPLPVGRPPVLTRCIRRAVTGCVDDVRQGAHASSSARPLDRYNEPPTARRLG